MSFQTVKQVVKCENNTWNTSGILNSREKLKFYHNTFDPIDSLGF